MLVTTLLGLGACGFGGEAEASSGLAFESDAAARRYVDTATETETTMPNDDNLLSNDRNPTSICESPDWLEAASTVFTDLGAELSSMSTSPTGRGCRATASSSESEIDVRLEIVDAVAVDGVATFRTELSQGQTLPLMGFTELDFVESDDRVSSSLSHSGVDRLEEHRWIAPEDTAFHLLIAVEPGGPEARPSVLTSMEAFEGNLSTIISTYAASSPATNEDDPLIDALTNVMQSVVDGEPLNDAATDQGLDAIAFEYNFVTNMEGIAVYRDEADCVSDDATADCTITALGSVYRFAFLYDDDNWLLDDFQVDG